MSDEPLTGVIHGMSNAEYHAHPALSASGLKLLAKSPRSFYAAMRDPQRPVRKESQAMRAGTLTHTMVLEPETFNDRYYIVPSDAPTRPTAKQLQAAKPSPATLSVIEWWANFELEARGREHIDGEEFRKASLQTESLLARPEVAAYLSRGESEVSAFWVDKHTGVHCRCRPDWVHPVEGKGVVLVDVKTTQDASRVGFPKQIARFDYHLQAAHYSAGWTAATGIPVVGFVFAAVESEWPYLAASYELDLVSLEEGEAQRRILLETYAECLRTDQWPGYEEGTQQISLPSWALNFEEVSFSHA